MEILRGYQLFQSFSRHQVLSIPWTTPLAHTGSNPESCMALAHLGRFIFHCGNSVTQFNSKYGQNCIGPIQMIQPGDSPSRISLSAFHIYWPPFITWGLFPQLINIFNLSLSLYSFTLLKWILVILSQSFSPSFFPCQWILVVISLTNSIPFSGRLKQWIGDALCWLLGVWLSYFLWPLASLIPSYLWHTCP